MHKDMPMDTLLIVGGVTLALLLAWLAARRRLDATLDEAIDFNDGWDWYDYSDDAAPDGLIAEVIDHGPRR